MAKKPARASRAQPKPRERRATPRRQTDAALRDTVTTLRDLLAATTDVVVVLNHEGRYIEVVQTNPRLLNRAPEDLLQKTLPEIFPLEQADYFFSQLQRALTSGDTVHAEYLLTIDRREIWFEASFSPMTDQLVLWVARDITERKLAEETSQMQAAQMEVVLKASLSLTANLELSQILENILQHALQLVQGAENAHLYLYDEQTQTLTFGAAKWTDHKAHMPKIPRPHGLTHTVAQTGDLLVVPNISSHPLFAEAYPNWHGSLMGVPLKLAQRVIGVMNVVFYGRHRFTESEVRALRLLADQGAVAVANARLFTAERTARAQAEALIEVARTFTTSLEVENLLHLILQQLARVVAYDSASVMLLVGDRLDIVAAWGLKLEPLSRLRFTAGQLAHVREVIEDRRPVVIVDTRADARWQHVKPEEPSRAWLGLPLVVKDRAIGILNLEKSQVGFYNEIDPNLALSFASQAAVAIENARLFESLSRTAQEMWRVSDVLQTLNSVPDVLETFMPIAEGLKELTSCERVSVLLLDERHEYFTLAAVDRPHPEGQLPRHFPVTETSAHREVLTGRMYISGDLSQEVAYPNEQTLLAAGYRSRVLVPLRVRDQISGMLSFLWTEPDGFHHTNLNLLSQMADALALAIEKSRLYTETRRGDLILQALAYVSRRLLMPGDSDEVLQDVLAHLGQATGTTFAFFFENHYDEVELTCSMRFLWSAQTGVALKNPPYFQNYSYTRAGMSRWVTLMVSGSPVYGLARDLAPGERLLMYKQKILSFAFVPIFVGDTWWGFLGFSDLARERQWSLAEIEALRSVAGAFGAAFARQRIEAAEQRQRALTEALRDGAAALNATLNLDEVLDRILDIIERVLPHDAADIMLLDETTREVRLARGRGFAERGLQHWLAAVRFQLAGIPNLQHMAATLKPIMIGDTDTHPDWILFPELSWIHSYVGAPIHAKGQLIGFLNLSSTIPYFFTPADAERLQIFADQAAAALENARLYRVTQQNSSELASLYHASSALLNPGSDLKALGARVAQIVTAEFNSVHCGVLLVQESTRELRVMAAAGDTRFHPPEPLAIDRQGLIAYAARTGEVVYVDDVRQDPRYLLGNELTRSELVVPLFAGGRVIGALDVESPDLQAFDERARRVLTAFGEQVALAMENVLLVLRLELARETAEEANQVKSQFLANTSHELRTPLTGVIGSLSMVVDGLCDTREEEHECVQIAYNASQRLLTIINNVLDIAKIEAGHMDVMMQAIDLAPILADVYGLMRIQADEKHITLEISMPPAFPKVWADPDMVRQVLLNLVGNAVKFTHKGGVILAAQLVDGRAEIAVQDTGIGVPLAQQPKLFQPFVQGDGSMTRQYGGTGLGLSISRKLAELMGGSVRLQSAGEGLGSTFTISLLLPSPVFNPPV